MPSSSCPPIERSCSAENQPGSGADIELCVAGEHDLVERPVAERRVAVAARIGARGALDAAAGDEGRDRARDHAATAAAPGDAPQAARRARPPASLALRPATGGR